MDDTDSTKLNLESSDVNKSSPQLPANDPEAGFKPAASTSGPISSSPQAEVSDGQSSEPLGDTSGQKDPDLRVMEKIWVKRAKQIVDSTKDDPYEQKRQIDGLKVEYNKSRFGKDIQGSK